MLTIIYNFDGKATIEEWIRADCEGEMANSGMPKRTVHLKPKSVSGPVSCVETTSDVEVGPGTFLRTTACYFPLAGEFFKAELSYWKSD